MQKILFQVISSFHFTRICTLCLFLTSLLFVCIPANSKTIVVLGDSLSAAYLMPQESGWVNLLAEKLKSTHPEWQVINSSVAGDTTANGLQRLPKVLQQYQPNIVIIELGGNDGLRGYPLIAIQKNLEKLITLSQQSHAEVLLLGIRLPPNYGQRYTEGIQAIYQDLHTKYSIPFVPFLLEHIALNPKWMRPDGIHPNAAAQPQIVDNIYPTLAPLLSPP